jgi:hypothetical protein
LRVVKRDKGIKLRLDPKSASVSKALDLPILQGKTNIPGSSSFLGNLF